MSWTSKGRRPKTLLEASLMTANASWDGSASLFISILKAYITPQL